MSNLHFFFFAIYPYICLAIFFFGSLVRFDREQYTWKSDSSQLLYDGQLRLGNILFHVGVLAVFGGHFVGLLTPLWVWHALGVSHAAKQLLAMTAGGIFGTMALVGLLILIKHRYLPRCGSRRFHYRCAHPLQTAYVYGHDLLPHLPVHPYGARVERFCQRTLRIPPLAAGTPPLRQYFQVAFRAT